MTEESTNLMLEHLRHIRGVVDETRAEMKHFIMRMGLVERNPVSVLCRTRRKTSNSAA